MKVTDPKNLNENYNELFLSGDLEGLMSLYETSAVLCPAPGVLLNGHEQIREHMKVLFTLKGELAATQLSCVQKDDLAMLHAKWSFNGTDGAGNTVDIGCHFRRTHSTPISSNVRLQQERKTCRAY